MRKLTLGAAVALTAALAVPVSAQDPLEDARAALDEYFRAWNAEDNEAIAVSGKSGLGRILMVAYTRRTSADGEKVRIISARRASRRERAAYTPGRSD